MTAAQRQQHDYIETKAHESMREVERIEASQKPRCEHLYYAQSLLDRQPAQDPRPASIEVFYVAHDEDQGEYIAAGVRVSPSFRTLDEARTFRDTCGIDGVYCLGVTLYPRNDAEAEQMNKTIFTEKANT